MGRHRKPEEEKKTTIFLRLPNPLLWQIEADAEKREQKPQDIILEILAEHYKKRDCQN